MDVRRVELWQMNDCRLLDWWRELEKCRTQNNYLHFIFNFLPLLISFGVRWRLGSLFVIR